MDQLSFIIIRHVRNEQQNLYWNECYNCIRKFYKNEKIYIIDDNSPYEPKRIGELFNTYIIKTEFPQRGELLPYYYFFKNEFSTNTVILHDSVFINSRINSNFFIQTLLIFYGQQNTRGTQMQAFLKFYLKWTIQKN